MRIVNTIKGTATMLVGARGSAVETARGRLVFMGVMFMFVFASLTARAGYLCVLQEGGEPRFETAMADQNAAAMAAGRADIVDRNGVLLATTLQTISLFADPKLITDATAVASDLKAIFPDMDEAQVAQKLSGKGRFVWLERGVSPKDMEAVNALGHPGLDFRFESKRFYPQENLTSHIVGYTGVDGQGFAGVERSFEKQLKDSSKPLQLSIDVRYQHALRRAMATAMAKFTAKGAAGAIVDVQTGELIAAVSLPDFNPQDVNAATDDQKFNRFALGVYEMGSTFKTFSTAAYLDKLGGQFSNTFDASKPLRRGNFTINDYHAKNAILTIPEIFMHSSNIGTALMGEKVGTTVLKSFYSDLGFDKPVPIALSERASPLVPNPWRDINTVTVSYGHGISVTPLHLVRAFSGIVNGGVLPALHILKGEHDEMRPRVVSEDTSDRMRRLLRLVVTHGTGENANVKGAMVAGKTGTSEKILNGRYVEDQLVSSFVGTFPADNPRYAILVSVDEPHGTKESYGYATAGWVAAPAVASVVRSMMTIENMPVADGSHDAAIEEEMAHYMPIEMKEKAHLASFKQ
ncbi:MAG: penicillin-binding protein 2 [Alphaproteobacteria bacterium]|nr:penicillin-binding protein 2 [Alphaproteobacteria bacterium]